MDEKRPTERKSLRQRSRIVILIAGAIVTAAVVALTQYELPHDDAWRAAVFVILGILVSVVLAHTADAVQRQMQETQEDIKDFLLERVNSRAERTDAVIDLCRSAQDEFRAVTFFPAVGIRDPPHRAPAEYLREIEKILTNKVDVTLVSVSCTAAKDYCKEHGFPQDSYDTLDWIERRIEELKSRFPERLESITVPPESITVNVCHNESSALMYYMSLDDGEDDGAGFRSTDARVVSVAKGGFDRYREFNKPPGAKESPNGQPRERANPGRLARLFGRPGRRAGVRPS